MVNRISGRYGRPFGYLWSARTSSFSGDVLAQVALVVLAAKQHNAPLEAYCSPSPRRAWCSSSPASAPSPPRLWWACYWRATPNHPPRWTLAHLLVSDGGSDLQSRPEARLQLTACFTSAAIFASSAAVSSFSAKVTGHRAPSSRRALSLKPSVAYRVLNFSAGWKKQTILPSLLA